MSWSNHVSFTYYLVLYYFITHYLGFSVLYGMNFDSDDGDDDDNNNNKFHYVNWNIDRHDAKTIENELNTTYHWVWKQWIILIFKGLICCWRTTYVYYIT